MVTFADWLEPWLACAVGSSVFHVAGNLSGQLAEVDAGQGVLDSVHGGHPGRIAEVEWVVQPRVSKALCARGALVGWLELRQCACWAFLEGST